MSKYKEYKAIQKYILHKWTLVEAETVEHEIMVWNGITLQGQARVEVAKNRTASWSGARESWYDPGASLNATERYYRRDWLE